MNNKGFTMIELLVMIGIVSALSSILFIDFSKNNKDFSLDRASQRLSQDIRRTQEMAVSALVGTANTKGYGIYLDKSNGNNTQYRIYRNENTTPAFELGTDYVMETIIMEKGIQICDIKDNTVSESDNVMSISFEPPDLNYIEANYYGHEAEIKVCVVSDNTKYKLIKVNNAGRVEMVNN